MSQSNNGVFMNMNETTTKRKERYEAPEVLDIKPVTICKGNDDDGTQSGIGEDEVN